MEKTDHELENFYRKTKLLPILGSDVFCKQINEMYLTKQPHSKEIPDQKNVCAQPTLLHICKIVADYHHVFPETLQVVDRVKGNLPRTIAIYLAAQLSGETFKTIADFFKNINYRSIPQVICRVNKLKFNIPSLANDIENLYKLI
jgi:chromosomal replication initiation ATPase DnaA